MPIALETIVKQLTDSGIIAPGKLENFVPPKGDPKDGEELLRELYKKGLLTKFQAQQVAAGKVKALVLGEYTIVDRIGAGGMGQVFKGEHRRMKRLVAIKTLPAATMKDEAAVARFQREVEAAAKLRHPHIVAADDAGYANGLHFLVMEYVDGQDLSALVKKNGPFSVSKAVNYILQAARDLEFAHKKGVVHRDIKPANLLLDTEGVVKILDMGLARISGDGNAGAQAELTGTGAVMGTVDYMAPEQGLSTKHADARADIYSLGCSLHYLLMGKPTFDGETITAKLLAHHNAPPPNLCQLRSDVPQQVQTIFAKMVAKKLEDRYQSMTAVIADLESCQAGLCGKALAAGESGVGPGSATVKTSSSPDTHTSEMTLAFGDRLLKAIPAVERYVEPEKKPRPKLSRPALIGLVGAGFLGVLALAGIMVSLKTKDGTLTVEVDQPDATVQVLDAEGKVEVSQKGGVGKITIGVDPGKHRLKVEKDGFVVFGQEFEIEVGGTREIAAKLEPVKAKAEIAENEKPQANENPQATMNDDGWKDLFDGKSLAGWTGDVGMMTIENGVLVNDGKRGTVTAPGGYQDVEIEVEFRLANGGNSGLGICYTGGGDPSKDGLEIQMLDDDGNPGIKEAQRCGSIYMLAASKPGHFKRWPDWNKLRVTSSGDDVRVELNGVLVTDANRSHLKQANSQHVGVSRTTGKVCLFPHTGHSEYRNFRIRSGKPWNTPAFQAWVKEVQALPAEQQIEAVSKKLMELNPGFDGKVTSPDGKYTPKIENGVVTGFWFSDANVTDISPVRALVGLRYLTMVECKQLTDLSPLAGMKLHTLLTSRSQVADLSPLRDMPINRLTCSSTNVSDLSPLKGTSLGALYCDNTPVSDLSPLHECKKLAALQVKKTKVTPAQVAALQKALPTCKIEWDGATSAAPAGEGANPKTPEPAASGTK